MSQLTKFQVTKDRNQEITVWKRNLIMEFPALASSFIYLCRFCPYKADLFLLLYNGEKPPTTGISQVSRMKTSRAPQSGCKKLPGA